MAGFPLAIHQAQPLIWRPSGQGPPPSCSFLEHPALYFGFAAPAPPCHSPARLSPHAPNPCDHDSKPNDESVDHDASRAPHFTRNAAHVDAMKTLNLTLEVYHSAAPAALPASNPFGVWGHGHIFAGAPSCRGSKPGFPGRYLATVILYRFVIAAVHSSNRRACTPNAAGTRSRQRTPGSAQFGERFPE